MAFVPGYSHGQTMKETTNMMVNRTAMITRTICLRQHCLCPWRWTPPLRLLLISRLVVLRLDHEILICVRPYVWFLMDDVLWYPICYVSQKWKSWDCDVWHNRHLELKIRVLTPLEEVHHNLSIKLLNLSQHNSTSNNMTSPMSSRTKRTTHKTSYGSRSEMK